MVTTGRRWSPSSASNSVRGDPTQAISRSRRPVRGRRPRQARVKSSYRLRNMSPITHGSWCRLPKPTTMLVRRLSAGALCFLASIVLVCDRVSSDTGDKQLARVKGVVGYQTSATSDFKPIFGRLDLPDDAYAVTKPNASAVLRLADSLEIDIGENTKVQIGAFNPAESGNQNTIVLNGGALHFNIRHPQGGQSKD